MHAGIEWNLRVISEAKNVNDRRYIAKPFNGDAKHWGVWDQKASRFLTNAEVGSLSPEEVREGI